MAGQSKSGQSAYLTSKGFQCPSPLLSDGSLLLVLCNASGAVCGASVIKPDGGKRLVAGTVKKALCVLNSGGSPETVIVAEGLATTLSAQQMQPDALAVVALDAGTFRPLPQCYAKKYPDARIIIAADNDIHA